MKVVQINAVCGTGSTGRICQGLSEILTAEGIENYILYASGHSSYPLAIKYATDLGIKVEALKSRIFGNYGFNSHKITKRLLSHLEAINPDVVHLHNLHGHNCNLETLCDWLKQHKKKVVLTQHDCWAFTAYCTHFTLCKCDKWMNVCHDCPQYKGFSWCADKSTELHNRKKDAFKGLDLTVVTPSEWLAGLTKQSFLRSFPVHVINNGINLNTFKPTPSDFRAKHNCEEKIILLGVAHQWSYRKGLDIFSELAKKQENKYQIVLVGSIPQHIKDLPSNIITIAKTDSAEELAKIYSAADYFINPTREENFPTVNIESIACGTPVITFDTGGSPEIIDKNTGIVTKAKTHQAIIEALAGIPITITHKNCIEKALHYNQDIKLKQYLKIYST